MAGDSLLLGNTAVNAPVGDYEADRAALVAHEEVARDLAGAELAEEIARLRYVAAGKALEEATAETTRAKARATTARGVLAVRLAGRP